MLVHVLYSYMDCECFSLILVIVIAQIFSRLWGGTEIICLLPWDR